MEKEQFFQILHLVSEPNRTKLENLYNDNWELIEKARGSKNKHQAWPGGYLDHIAESCGIAIKLYETLSSIRVLPFSLSDAILVLALHDLEKPWKHEVIGGVIADKPEFRSPKTRKHFVFTEAVMHGISLTDDHKNALTYIEGEGNDYVPYKRVQWPLAAFVACCDTISARIWYDYPRESTVFDLCEPKFSQNCTEEEDQ